MTHTDPGFSWAAKLDRVREIGLRGEADSSYWRARLAPFGLAPAERDGSAEITIVTADAKFRGLRFQEASVSIALALPSTGGLSDEVVPSARLLLGAFNSRWIFAQVERRLFHAPYAHAAVAVRSTIPVAIHVVQDGVEVLRAAMGTSDGAAHRAKMADSEEPMHRAPTLEGEESWEGRVYLSSPRAGALTAPACFVARLRGYMRVYPFAEEDVLTLRPRAAGDVIADLIASSFRPREWTVRPDAEHAKSRTYR